MTITRYKLNFVCPLCKKKSNVHVVDEAEVWSEAKDFSVYEDMPNNHNPKTHTYIELNHQIGKCSISSCMIDYDTLTRSRIECANCGWELPESEEKELFFWLKENNYLEKVVD
jgi:hypothetical protein